MCLLTIPKSEWSSNVDKGEITGFDGAVAKSSSNGLVITGFTFQYRLPGQVRSECLTCTFRASCCSARLSLAFTGSSVRDRSAPTKRGARCSSMVRAFARGTMGRRIDPSWGGPIELFLVPASAPRLV